MSVTVTAVASDGPAFVTDSWYDSAPPATTVAGPVLTIARSATGVTVVLADAVLSVGSGSAVVEDTDAVFVMVPPWSGASTVTVIVGCCRAGGSVGSVHVTETLPTLLQDQPAPVALTNVTPAGSVSATSRLSASDGPLLVTTSV